MTTLLFIVVVQIFFDIVFSPYQDDKYEQTEAIKQNLLKQSIKPNDQVIRKGIPNNFKNDLYYTLINVNWTTLIAIVLFYFVLSNLFFAFLYLMAGSPTAENAMSFEDAFFFSVQTMSTIGYGVLSPQGFYANLIVMFEAAYGLISIAMLTGLIFNKLSKPSANILYTNNILDTYFDGKRCLTFRMGNVRGNDIVEAKIKLTLLKDEITSEGKHFRRIYDLPVTRDTSPFFKLTWNVFHVIDENSPLFNKDSDELNSFGLIMVTLTGHDGSFSNTIYSRKAYSKEDIEKNKYFKDVVKLLPNGSAEINYHQFHDIIELAHS